MLNEHTLDQLRSLRLDGMVRAIEEQATSTAATALGFDERLTLLVQREIAWRDDRRVARLLKAAKLKVSCACIEDINWRASRALDRAPDHRAGRRRLAAPCAQFADHGRHRQRQDMAGVCPGASGRAQRLLGAVHARAHGCSTSCRSRTATAASRGGWRSWPSSICWSSTTSRSRPWAAAERNDLLELLDDRVGTRSTLITSQLPVKAWHTYLNDPTLADAILDRVVHSSHKIELKGTKSLRDAEAAAAT